MSPSSSRAGGLESAHGAAAPPVESRLVRALLAGEFALVAEIAPPLSADREALRNVAEPLRDRVDAFVVRERADRGPRMPSLAAAGILASAGLDPIIALAMGSRRQPEFASDLVGAAALGVRAILILDEDPAMANLRVVGEQSGRACLAGIGLAATVRDSGTLPTGDRIGAPPSLFVGALAGVGDPITMRQLRALHAIADRGAQFAVLQMACDLDAVRRTSERLDAEGLNDRMFMLVGIDFSGSHATPNRHVARYAELLASIADLPGFSGALITAHQAAGQAAEAIDLSGVRLPDGPPYRPHGA